MHIIKNIILQKYLTFEVDVIMNYFTNFFLYFLSWIILLFSFDIF
jgi:hypothetical protein